MQKWFILSGVILILIGIFLPWILKSGVGQLPGDVFVKKGSFSLYIPITTCILISIILTLLFYFWHK